MIEHALTSLPPLLHHHLTFIICSVGTWSFPGSSVGKESACNAGDPGSTPGLERSTGEGISYPHQYSWASLVAQLIKNLPAIREIWVQSLGWEEPLEKGKAIHSRILAWRIPWGHKESDMTEQHALWAHIICIMCRACIISFHPHATP